jgi:alanyl-tRNA synthetase
LSGAAVVLLSVTNGRPLVVAATDDAGRARGLKAGALVGVAARALGGGGGGRDDIAQGGGAKSDAADDALAAVLETIRGALASG